MVEDKIYEALKFKIYDEEEMTREEVKDYLINEMGVPKTNVGGYFTRLKHSDTIKPC